MQFEVIFFAIALFVQNIVFFKQSTTTFVTKPRFKYAPIVMSVFNVAFLWFIMEQMSEFIVFGYAVSLVIYIFELRLCFKAHINNILMCVCSLMMHLLAIQIIVFSVISMFTGLSLFELTMGNSQYYLTLAISYVINSLYIISAILFSPKDTTRILGKNFATLRFLIAIFLVAFLGLSTNMLIYNIVPIDFEYLAIAQIIITLIWLVMVYIGVFIIIGFELLNETNSRYEKEIENVSIYQDTLAIRAQIVNEINCTKNELVKMIVHGEIQSNIHTKTYTEHLEVILNFVHDDYKELVKSTESPENIIAEFEKGNKKISYDYIVRETTGECKWYNCVITIKRETASGDVIAVNTITDINERKQLELDLIYRSERDPLVGAYNKRSTESLITTHIENYGTGILFMIDLDNFKAVNDNFGHTYGDAVLCETYDKIKLLFRDADIIGRIGGDEFIVFMKGTTSIVDGTARAEMICKQLQKAYHNEKGVEIEISCSVGLSISPVHSTKFDELFHMADVAMYYSKDHGKNTYTIYNKKVHEGYKSKRVVVES